MSLESPDRSFIIQELVNVASEVKKISHSQGVELSSPLAMSRALIGWGKIYLDESLITMGRREQVLTIDDYLEEMGPLQTEQFALGLSFGFLASAISSIETGENHLERFNKYIAAAPNPLTPEPSANYTRVETYFSDILDPQEESIRLRRMATQDPTLLTILSKFHNLPASVKIHFASLNTKVRVAVEEAVMMYKDAIVNLDLLTIFPTHDLDWLAALVKQLPEPPAT